MASTPVKGVIRQVKPLLSTDRNEAKRRVLNLYKMFNKNIPNMILSYNLPLTYVEVKQKIRSEFVKNKDVTDVRIIDMLVIKGQMEFHDIYHKIKQRCQLLYMVKATSIPVPKDFLSKFMSGTD